MLVAALSHYLGSVRGSLVIREVELGLPLSGRLNRVFAPKAALVMVNLCLSKVRGSRYAAATETRFEKSGRGINTETRAAGGWQPGSSQANTQQLPCHTEHRPQWGSKRLHSQVKKTIADSRKFDLFSFSSSMSYGIRIRVSEQAFHCLFRSTRPLARSTIA